MHVNMRTLNEFELDPARHVFFHPDNYLTESHDCGEDYAYETLKKVNDLTSHSEEFLPFIKDQSSRYHLSHQRVNFLDALQEIFPKDAAVLEIGSGCGIITRWLGEQFQTVDALEEYVNRAEITRYRTKDLDNVNVYCGNPLNTIFDKKYDFIILGGSIDHLSPKNEGTVTSRQAFTEFFTRIRAALKNDGIILIVVEDDIWKFHSSECLDKSSGEEDKVPGVNTGLQPSVFSRNELISILTQSGFSNCQVIHVFPDSKYTETVIPENPEVLSLNPQNWIKWPDDKYQGDQYWSHPGSGIQKSFTDLEFFFQSSHSYILLASQSEIVNLTVPWLIKSIRNHEHIRPEFYHEITLVGESNAHVQKKDYIVKRRRLSNSGNMIHSDLFDFQLVDNKYIIGDLLFDEVKRELSQKNPDGNLKRILKELHDQLLARYSTGVFDSKGFPLIAGEAIDYTFWNIIVDSRHTFHFIDRKWVCKKPIPVDFILFRNLFYLTDKTKDVLDMNNHQTFIVRIIRSLYPDYSYSRLSAALEFEGLFQSYVSGHKKEFFLDKPIRYFLADTLQGIKGVLYL
ncbi:MAG: Methyltransferase domain protein [Methanoregulaceae archaeon PtaB.Bin056]|nr:MAG: Methyltransferase domain protein [Methanoregulaceae archaeon PtaB.Bin056]